MRTASTLGFALSLLLPTAVLFPGSALAQTAKTAPAQKPVQAPPQVEVAPATDTTTEGDKASEALLRGSTGGLTSEKVFQRAAATSFSAKAAEESLRAAAAKVDAAWASFLPRLVGTASYLRNSSFTPPSFQFVLPAPLAPIELSFPLVLDNWSLQATLTVPISDYLFRISQNYAASKGIRTAAENDLAAARSKSGADGAVAFYTWIRARGTLIVATQARGDQETHLKDVKNIFNVGNASKVDVLRAETNTASADLQVERAKNLVELAERQLRQALHASDSEEIASGEDLEAPVTGSLDGLKSLVQEARSSRPEVRSFDLNIGATKDLGAVARASMYPQLAAVGTALYANPNQRVFPASGDWFPTWSIGVQATWSPNDLLTGHAAGRESDSRAAQLDAQKQALLDALELEVTQAYQSAKEADFAVEASKRQLASATEAHRVARELFLNGRGTATQLTDSETELTRARLDALNSIVDTRLARVRLNHATGRDAKAGAAK